MVLSDLHAEILTPAGNKKLCRALHTNTHTHTHTHTQTHTHTHTHTNTHTHTHTPINTNTHTQIFLEKCVKSLCNKLVEDVLHQGYQFDQKVDYEKFFSCLLIQYFGPNLQMTIIRNDAERWNDLIR